MPDSDDTGSSSLPEAGSRQLQKEATRRAILDAAITNFAQLGYDGTNFREITALCGAQRPLILYHYQSKEKLWKQAVQEVEHRFNDAFERRYRPPSAGSDRDKVRYSMACFIDTLCEIPEYGQILLREGSTVSPRMEWLARHFVPRKALAMELADPTITERIHKTVLRDIIASAVLAFVGLGPLMERSLAGVTKKKAAGVYPLSKSRKQEFLDYMVKLVFD